jgi:hypothetical protein
LEASVNLQKLKQAEQEFLMKYPGGFNHPSFEAIAKKHKVDQMTAFTHESFSKAKFNKPNEIVENMVKVVSRSSMVSLFEKPKFRDMVKDANQDERQALCDGLKRLLHGSQKKGFESILEVLRRYKLAKWSLISIIPAYYKPQDEVFVKPTTAKGVIEHFELEGLVYKPQPSWEFYSAYREQILNMREKVDSCLSPNTPAFSGFLMMSFQSK